LVAAEQRFQAIQDESRKFMIIANDNEQHNRMNNQRIRGLVDRSVNCQTTVTDFIRNKLHIHVSPDDLEVAHPLPTISTSVEEPQAASQSSSLQQEPIVIVRFWRRELREVLRN